MITKEKSAPSYTENFEKAIATLKKSGFENIKADCEGWEQPARLVNQDKDHAFVPDITALRDGKKSYFEISQRTDPEELLITKWKLLETMAKFRSGIFKIFAPRGHIKFTQEMVDRYGIQAEIVKI